MEQYRVVDTPQGPQTYLLVKKRVKNLNLRLDRRGQILLSVPFSCPEERADALILEKWEWIRRHLPQEEGPALLPEPGGLRPPAGGGGGPGLSPGGRERRAPAPGQAAEHEEPVGQLPLPAGVYYPEHRLGPLSRAPAGLCGPP